MRWKVLGQEAVSSLESEWTPATGFFWKLRQGEFDPHAFVRTLEALRRIEVRNGAQLPRRLVSLLWYGPLVMEWNAHRVQLSGSVTAEYVAAAAAITNEIERLLGVP